MRDRAPFQPDDLADLGHLLSLADRVVPMRDVFKGDTDPRVIGLRHDVDDNPGAFDTALQMAEWEFAQGFSSSYYLLHGAAYWERAIVEAPRFEELGHEVGLHVNAIAEGLRERRDPRVILRRALRELRASGVKVYGTAAHGDPLCRDGSGAVTFVNDELFTESRRPQFGQPDRVVARDGVTYQLDPRSRAEYGLEYDANWLPRGDYISDSGGEWSQAFEGVAARFGAVQLHMLVHPDWWTQAFAPVEVAA